MGMAAGGAMGMGHYGGMMHPMQMQGLHAMGSMGYLPQQAPYGRPAPSQSADAGGAASSAGTSQARPCSGALSTYMQPLRAWPGALGVQAGDMLARAVGGSAAPARHLR